MTLALYYHKDPRKHTLNRIVCHQSIFPFGHSIENVHRPYSQEPWAAVTVLLAHLTCCILHAL